MLTRDFLVKSLLTLGALAALFCVPLFLESPFYLHLLITVCAHGIMAVSLRLIYITGHVSFAHAGFMAIGAYTSALLVSEAGLPYLIGLVGGGALAGIAGLVIGYPVLRVRGVYFFMITFAFGNAVTVLVANYFQDYFGGHSGINVPPAQIPVPFGSALSLVSKSSYYYLGLVLLLVTMLVMYRLNHSRFGVTLRAIREADTVAQASGINVAGYKLVAFAIACLFAGVSGSLWAHYLTHIDAGVFGFHLSTNVLLYMLVGGAASVFGPVLGVFVLVMLTPVFHAMGIALELLTYGVVLILVMIFMPEGFWGLGRRLQPWVQRLWSRRSTGPNPGADEAGSSQPIQ